MSAQHTVYSVEWCSTSSGRRKKTLSSSLRKHMAVDKREISKHQQQGEGGGRHGTQTNPYIVYIRVKRNHLGWCWFDVIIFVLCVCVCQYRGYKGREREIGFQSLSDSISLSILHTNNNVLRIDRKMSSIEWNGGMIKQQVRVWIANWNLVGRQKKSRLNFLRFKEEGWWGREVRVYMHMNSCII